MADIGALNETVLVFGSLTRTSTAGMDISGTLPRVSLKIFFALTYIHILRIPLILYLSKK